MTDVKSHEKRYRRPAPWWGLRIIVALYLIVGVAVEGGFALETQGFGNNQLTNFIPLPLLAVAIFATTAGLYVAVVWMSLRIFVATFRYARAWLRARSESG